MHPSAGERLAFMETFFTHTSWTPRGDIVRTPKLLLYTSSFHRQALLFDQLCMSVDVCGVGVYACRHAYLHAWWRVCVCVRAYLPSWLLVCVCGQCYVHDIVTLTQCTQILAGFSSSSVTTVLCFPVWRRVPQAQQQSNPVCFQIVPVALYLAPNNLQSKQAVTEGHVIKR